MFRNIWLFFFCILFINQTEAQTAFDALRFSNLRPGGTARYVGVGGSLGALGTDFSVLSTNPAGLAMYRRSDFSITPSLLVTATDAQLRDGSDTPLRTDDRSSFNLNNLGVVFANRSSNPRWKTANFGMGLNRLANFNQSVFYEGKTPGSIVTRWQDFANSGEGISDFEEGLAIDAGALYQLDGNDFYFSDFEGSESAEVNREETIISKGSINELVFSFAGNYEERIMIGATLGIPFVSFTEEKIYEEEDMGEGTDGDIPVFNFLNFRQNLNTTGAGVNFKLGLIYRLNQMVRLGVAFHTPTLYWLDDSFDAALTYSYTDGNGESTLSADSPDGLFEYRLRTPWRFIGSAGVVVGRRGFITGEIEWVDYRNASFDFGEFGQSEQETNQEINDLLTQTLNVRIGGELVLDIFQLRGGFQILNSPLEADDTVNFAYSFGAGFRQSSFYMDFAYVRTLFEETYVPYVVDQAPIQYVDNNVSNNRFMLTVGFRF